MVTADEKYKYYQERVDAGRVIDFMDGLRLCFNCSVDIYTYLDVVKVKTGTITGCHILGLVLKL